MSRLDAGIEVNQFENRYKHSDGYAIMISWSTYPDISGYARHELIGQNHWMTNGLTLNLQKQNQPS